MHVGVCTAFHNYLFCTCRCFVLHSIITCFVYVGVCTAFHNYLFVHVGVCTAFHNYLFVHVGVCTAFHNYLFCACLCLIHIIHICNTNYICKDGY